MGRFVFVTWGGGGNATATMPVVAELVARGHDVEVMGSPTQQRDVDPTGASFHPFMRLPPNDGRYAATDLARGATDRFTIAGAWRSMRWIAGSIRNAALDVVDLLAGDRSAIVVGDEMLPGVLMGAEVAGVRSASLVHTIWHHPIPGALPMGFGLRPATHGLAHWRNAAGSAGYAAAFDVVRPALNHVRRDLGLPPVRRMVDQFFRADLLLVLTSPSFDWVPSGIPSHARYVGAPAMASTGDWQPPPGDEPLVVVSLSTTRQGQGALVHRLASVLGAMPVRAVVASGPIDPAGVPRYPNVSVQSFVPHVEVLPHASLVVTHGGHGTVMAAMRHGVPALCLPHGRDQPDVAVRVEAAGAGLRLSKRATPERLASTIEQLLTDERFTRRAGELAARIGEEGDAAPRAATELEALL